MYGFWRLGFSPTPSAGAGSVANGEATNTSSSPKKDAIAARIGTVQGRTSLVSLRFNATAADPIPRRTRSQRRSDPSCPPQNEESA